MPLEDLRIQIGSCACKGPQIASIHEHIYTYTTDASEAVAEAGGL